MSCIRPIAPRGEIACSSPALSIWMIARIQSAGMAKRVDASVTKLSNLSMEGGRDAVCAQALDSNSAEAATRHTNGATTATTHEIARGQRSHANASAGSETWLSRCRSGERFLAFG